MNTQRVTNLNKMSVDTGELSRQVSGLVVVEQEWEHALQTIPVDLEETARQTQALQRRREIKSAAELLRLILAYCVGDWPLRLVGMWAHVQELGSLSDVAVLKRLQKAGLWLKLLISGMLETRCRALQMAHPARVRIVDGSALSVPGSQGTDYRLHLSWDLGSQRIDGLEVSAINGGGETLARHPSQPGDIWLADRGYAHRAGVGAILDAGGEVVIRIGWATFPLEHVDGTPFDLFAWLRSLTATTMGEQDVVMVTAERSYALRILAQPLPLAIAEKKRRRIRRQASKKGTTPDQRTLEAAGYIMVITSLPQVQWTTAQVLQLYRLRWQVELLFKRLKSLLNLDQLRAKGPTLAQTYLLGKLLAALMIDRLTDQAARRCPEMFSDTQRPISLWRWTTIGYAFLFTAVCGYISWVRFLDALPDLRRYLDTGSRRHRLSQASVAKDVLQNLLRPPILCSSILS